MYFTSFPLLLLLRNHSQQTWVSRELLGFTCWVAVSLGFWQSKTCMQPSEWYQMGTLALRFWQVTYSCSRSAVSVSTQHWNYGRCHLLPLGNHLYNQKEHLPLLLLYLPECWHPPYNSRGKEKERIKGKKKKRRKKEIPLYGQHKSLILGPQNPGTAESIISLKCRCLTKKPHTPYIYKVKYSLQAS